MSEQPANEPTAASDESARDALTARELAPGAVRRERDLPVSTEEAWSLLQDADGLSRWLADEVDVIVAPGERGTLRDGAELRSVVIEEVEEGRRVSLRWWLAEAPDDAAIVDLVLEPGEEPGGARLIVTELPLRVLATPDAVPGTWTLPEGGGTTGPQLALAGVR